MTPTKEMQREVAAIAISWLKQGDESKALRIKSNWVIIPTKEMQREASKAARIYHDQGHDDVVCRLIKDWGAENPIPAFSVRLAL